MKTSEIESAIRNLVKVAHVEVLNPRLDGLHFEAVVVSEDFRGKSLIEQHQIIMNGLKNYFHSSLHALSLKTSTPEKWKDR